MDLDPDPDLEPELKKFKSESGSRINSLGSTPLNISLDPDSNEARILEPDSDYNLMLLDPQHCC